MIGIVISGVAQGGVPAIEEMALTTLVTRQWDVQL
jgi:hypothetical protein